MPRNIKDLTIECLTYATTTEERSREELRVLQFVEPRALDVEQPKAGHEPSQRERVDRELSDRPVRAGVGFVVQNMHRAVADL